MLGRRKIRPKLQKIIEEPKRNKRAIPGSYPEIVAIYALPKTERFWVTVSYACARSG